MPTGGAPIVELPPGPVGSHLPAGSIVIDAIDHANTHPSPLAGRGFQSSPETIGDQIPIGDGTKSTSIVGINAIMSGSKDHEICTGWVYKGADGMDYMQRRTDSTPQPTVQGNGLIVSGSPPLLGPVHRYRMGDLTAGESLTPMDGRSRVFDDKLGVPSSGASPLPIIHASNERPEGVENRALAAMGVSHGDFATVQLQGQSVIAQIAPQSLHLEHGLGRNG